MRATISKLRRFLPLFALACGLLVSSTSCQQAILEADGEQVVIRRYLSGDPRTIDPHMSGDVPSSTMCGLAYEQLYEYDYFARPVELIPCLAASMPEISADRLTYTFSLRKDVFFHDDPCFPGGTGRKMVAQDFEYSLKRVASLPDSNGWSFFEKKIIGLDEWRSRVVNAAAGIEDPEIKAELQDAEFAKSVPGIKIIDDYTLSVHLTEVYPQFLYAITLSYGAVVPHEAVKYYGPNFFRRPVGTGPFRLTQWTDRLQLVWERHQKYRKATYPEPPAELPLDQGFSPRSSYLEYVGKRLPLADKIIYRIIKESQASWLEFLAGNLDVNSPDKDQFTSAIQNDELTPSMRDKGLHLIKYDTPTVEYLSFNMKDPVVGLAAGERGKALRKAISLAFDRDYYIKHYQNGRGVPAELLLPESVMDVLRYDGDYVLPYVRFDLEDALDTLRSAGFIVEKAADGSLVTKDPDSGQQVKIKFLLRSPALKDFARFLSYLGQSIGINVECELLTFTEFLRRQDEGVGQAYHAAWVMDYPDAQNMLLLLYGPNGNGGYNSANYHSEAFDAMYQEMGKLDQSIENQRKQKLDLILKMHKEVEEDCPWVPIRYYKSYYMFHDWFSPLAPNPFNYSSAKFLASDSKARATNAAEWREIPALPAIIIAAILGVIAWLFTFKVLRQP